jgi:cytochrome c
VKKFNLVSLIFISVSLSQAQPLNTLTTAEKKEGWKLLFDGQTTKGWRNFNSDKIGASWKVKEGAIYLDTLKREGGDIITNEEFENYELSLEWKIQPCGNSGVIFNVQEGPKYDQVWKTGPEMQVLDNACHPDAKIKKHRAGNLYDLIESKTETTKPAGDWNLAKLISNKGHLEIWLNGTKQVETQMFTPEWEALIKASKFKNMPDFGKAKKGHISLQDHGNMVWYRNIKIKIL